MNPGSPTGAGAPACGPIGKAGPGPMGSAIAKRWLRGGFAVLGCDILPEPVAAARQRGVLVGSAATQMAGPCRRLGLSLPGSASVRTVLDEMREQPQADEHLLGQAEAAGLGPLDNAAIIQVPETKADAAEP